MAPDKPEIADSDLDLAFAALRVEEAVVPDALTSRLLGDAARLQPARLSLSDRLDDVLNALSAMIGGWRGGMALSASAVMGIWIGYASPDTFNQGFTEFELSAEDSEADTNLLDALFPESDA